MDSSEGFKYLISSDRDSLWGVTVDDVGKTDLAPGFAAYPPDTGHPDPYLFSTAKGRVLDNYQLIYISRGQGTYFGEPGRGVPLHQGDLFILRPGIWHSYVPDQATGWCEHWIGLRGPNIDNRFKKGFFDPGKVIYRIGVREEVIALYDQALEIAVAEKVSCQQMLAGIGNLILGLAMYYDSNRQFPDQALVGRIDRARAVMRERQAAGITPEEVAREVGMSYSWFRKVFRQYTSLSPSDYLNELRIQQAKTMLQSSPMSIKEIAYELNYSDSAYFATRFKLHTGLSPSQFREKFGNRT